MTVKKALCIGINDYPYDGNDLNGCVNDSLAWAELLHKGYGFAKADITVLHDAEATKASIIEHLKKLLTGLKSGDVVAFTNSSHGSYIADADGDEEKFDEILCPYDIDKNHISDDELRALLTDIPAGVRCSVVLDNCFSGTATRAAVSEILPGMLTPDDRRVRFLSPALRGLPVLKNPWTAKRKNQYPMSRMKEVLLSGCTDKEYSYDAYIDGGYHGAMTYYATRAITQAGYKLTYAQLHQRLMNLITDYPQHPQLEGSRENLKRPIFS
jgi:metacaspase-1